MIPVAMVRQLLSRSQRIDVMNHALQSPGTSQQNFNFTLATSTGLTSVAGVGCSSCSGISMCDTLIHLLQLVLSSEYHTGIIRVHPPRLNPSTATKAYRS